MDGKTQQVKRVEVNLPRDDVFLENDSYRLGLTYGKELIFTVNYDDPGRPRLIVYNSKYMVGTPEAPMLEILLDINELARFAQDNDPR